MHICCQSAVADLYLLKAKAPQRAKRLVRNYKVIDSVSRFYFFPLVVLFLPMSFLKESNQNKTKVHYFETCLNIHMGQV